MGPFPDAWVAELHHVLSEHVGRGDLPGLVALVAHGGATHVEVIGTRAFGDIDPLPGDAIFRIASLSKPISAVAAMTLIDDGTLALDDTVDDLLPELADAARAAPHRRRPRRHGAGDSARSPSRTCSRSASASATT